MLNMRSSCSTATGAASEGAPRTSHKPQASASAAPPSAGHTRCASQAGCTAAATSSNCNKVDTQLSSAPPAISRAPLRPSRTARPSVAMVAVLDTKPEARAESATACRACSKRRARWAAACTPSSKASNCTITCGLSVLPHKGRSGTSGNASSTSAASTMPSRTSAGRNHWRAKPCRRSRPASMAVSPTASPAASGRLQAHNTPIR